MQEPFQNLVRTLARLPGVGRRSAERMAYRLLAGDRALIRELKEGCERADREMAQCSRCGGLTTVEQDPCRICTDPMRDGGFLAVVEGGADIQILEQARAFHGRYFCLKGKVSPMRGETVSAATLESLRTRVKEENVHEVLLALDTDVESDATAALLAEFLHPLGVKVSRLAFGMPAGSGLAYSDPETLSRALRGRQDC